MMLDADEIRWGFTRSHRWLVSNASGPRRWAAACGAAGSVMPSSSVPAARMPLMVR